MSRIARLLETYSPPAQPVCPGRADAWAAVEREIGLTLPEDYKEIVDVYGAGSFNEAIHILSPFRNDYPCFNFLYMLDAYAATQKERMVEYPGVGPDLPPFERGSSSGILPWARDDNGGLFCWLVGDETPWPILSLDDHWSWDYSRFTGITAAEFLADLMRGERMAEVYTEFKEEFEQGRHASFPAMAAK